MPHCDSAQRRWGVLTTAVLACVLLTSACGGGQRDPGTGSVTKRVDASDGGRVQLGDAAIEIPRNALAQDASVSIHGRPLAADPGRPDNIIDAYEFDTGGVDLRSDVRLWLPPSASNGASTVPTLAHQEADGRWNVIPAEVSAGRLTSSVRHLSTWFGIDLGEWLAKDPDLLNRFAQVLGLRARPPECDRGSAAGRATVAYSAGERLNQPVLLICLEAGSADSLTMQVVNNRTYAVALQPSGFGVRSHTGLDATSSAAQLARLYGRNGDVVIAPGDEAILTVAAHQATASVTYRPQPSATLSMVAAMLLEGLVDKELPTEHLVALGNCGRDMATSVSQAQALEIATSCAAEALVNWLGEQKLIIGILRVPVALAAKALGYVAASVKLATPILDAWADLSLFRAASDRIVVTRTAAADPTRPTPEVAPPQPAEPPPATQPPAMKPVVHYNCANDNSNLGRYVPNGRYWQNPFTTKGSRVTGGWVLIGANTDGGNHQARVGIYASSGLSSPLATVDVPVTGYDGESFSLPVPLTVSPGQQLYLTVVGIGDFTAYNNQSGCFIGRVDGTT